MATEKSCLSTVEVCSILESSAKAGVSELKFGGLHVKFGRPTENATGFIPYPFVQQNSPAPAPVTELTEAQHIKQAKESLEDAELSMREDQLAIALVEDPVRYEELLRQGDLSDDMDDSDQDDDQ